MIRKELRSKSGTELEILINNYFKEYHPAGYGTWVSNRFFDKENDEYVAIIHRSSSCD